MADNTNVVLISGGPNTGKTTSLRNLPQGEMVLINADNKRVPFKHTFIKEANLADPKRLPDYIASIEKQEKVRGAVLDTITLAMAEYERQYVAPKMGGKEGGAAWADYGNYYRDVMHAVKTGTKDYVILAHEDTQLNEESNMRDSKVPVKGAVGRIGVEADFTTIVCSMQIPIYKIYDMAKGEVLPQYQNDLLKVTPEELEDGMKFVFLTRANKDFSGKKARSPMGLWSRNELFIDNDVQLVFNKLKTFYSK